MTQVQRGNQALERVFSCMLIVKYARLVVNLNDKKISFPESLQLESWSQRKM